jgi:hypothetical protein
MTAECLVAVAQPASIVRLARTKEAQRKSRDERMNALAANVGRKEVRSPGFRVIPRIEDDEHVVQ